MNKITAIGEILFDVYPGLKKLGGAPLNFLYHIHKLTGTGTIISRIGNDELGAEALHFIDVSNISSRYIQLDLHHHTGTATVELNEKNEPAFNIEPNKAYDFIEVNSDLHKMVENKTDCLYFGTLAQRSKVTRNTIQALLGKNIKYFCDLNIRQKFFNKDIIRKSLSAADVLKVNIDELKLLNDLIIKEKFKLEETSQKLMKDFNIDLLAITKGSQGSVLIKDDIVDKFKVDPVDSVDTVGAGDAFASVLCLGYLKDWELSQINKIANFFASEICLINGALPADDEIYTRFKRNFE